MTILVDSCLWHLRDLRWCHCVSDTSLDELHEFAATLGIPPRAFQGDHYDLHEERRATAIELGALAVTSRELLTRLKAANLRLAPDARRVWKAGRATG